MDTLTILIKLFTQRELLEICISKKSIEASGEEKYYGRLHSKKYGSPIRMRDMLYQEFLIVRDSKESLARDLFHLAMSEPLWFGSPGDYKYVIEWNNSKNFFEERQITPEEDALYNKLIPPAQA